jgi:hypothetical protein
MCTENICSAMWLSGRYDTEVSLAKSGITPGAMSAVQVRLLWDSITPLGGPVVPEV